MTPSWVQKFWKNATGHPPSEPQKVEPGNQSHPDSDCRLHAVVIGINEYKHQKKLNGAVPDADAFYGYLTGDLSVPKNNIKRVTNAEATRGGIINALLGLSKNDNIQEGDPIVIYYSGHGGEIPAPAERAENGAMIQCLLPVDAGTKEVEGEPPIPDFVIGALLEEIANKKGDNITVIFDCCHSAGGSRDDKEPAGARYVSSDQLRPLPPNVDDNLKLQLSTNTGSSGFIGQAMASHVLIAACSHSERAWEDGTLKRGYFTLALLQRLRAANIDSLTYEGLLKRVPTLASPEPQRPVCEGKHINRVIFDAKVSSSNNIFIPVVPGTPGKSTGGVPPSGTAPPETPSTASEKYYLQAGAAQGISPGSIFTLHTTNFLGTDNTLPGKVKVGDVGPFKALLEPVDGETVDMSKASYARQVGYGKQEALGVFFTEEFVEAVTPDPNWEKAFASAADSFVLHPVDEPLAHLTVGLTEDKKRVTFKIREQAAMKYGVDTLPHTVELKAESVVNVLRAIARWNWHLRRTPVNRPFESDVALEFLQLRQISTPGNWGRFTMVPESKNLIVGGEARIVVDSKGHRYGLRITNNSGRDLYAYATYFSVQDQSINLFYNKVASNESGFVDPSLPKADPSLGPANMGNVLTIGYGSSGVAPARHFMTDDGTDIGIYKVFLTTECADFDTLQQESPFNDPSRDMDRSREGLPAPDLPYWDTLTFAVVQSRNPFPDTGSTEQGMLSSEPLPLLKQESDGAGTVACQKGKEKDFDWFKTDPLTAEILNQATAMQLRTFSREERGIRPGVEGKTEFHICILDGEEFPKCGEDNQPLVWVSHSNEPGPNLLPLDGKVFTRDQSIWDHVQPGDAFLVMSYVRGLGWKNIAEQGSLRIW